MRVEIDRITSLLTAIYDGEAWHGPSTQEILTGVTPEMAVFRPSPSVHNLAELIVHLTNWRIFVLEKLTDSVSFDIILNSEADWSVINELTPEKWQEILANLQETQEELIETLSRITSHKLNDQVPGRRYNYYTLLHGMLHHEAYHSGQMAQLKKMLV